METFISRGTNATGHNASWTSLTSAYDAGTGTFATNSGTTIETQSITIEGYDIGNVLTTNGTLFSTQVSIKQYVSNTQRYGTPYFEIWSNTVGGTTGVVYGPQNLTLSNNTSNIDTFTVPLRISAVSSFLFFIRVYWPRTGSQSATTNFDYAEVTINYAQGQESWNTIPIAFVP